MKNKALAKRYAEGFLDFCRVTIGLKQAVEELKNIKFLLQDDPEFKDFLESLQFSIQEKNAVIDKSLSGFSMETRGFIKLLIQKERVNYLNAICDYIRVTYGRDGMFDALLKTSYPLSLELVRKIKEHAEIKLKKKLNLFLELDAGLLGGIKIIVGNTVIDGSVRGRLDRLRQRLITLKV